jgi:hypothetical protein
MTVSTSDGMVFDNEFDYMHDQIFIAPHREFNAALDPHKQEYLSNHTDVDHTQVHWPTDARGVEFLKAINKSDSEYGTGGMHAKETNKEDN